MAAEKKRSGDWTARGWVKTVLLLQFLFFGLAFSVGHGGPALLGLVIAVPAARVFLQGSHKSYVWLFYYMCAIFMVGMRTMYLGEGLRFHPSEMMLWALVVPCLFIRPEPGMRNTMTMWVPVLAVCAAWGVMMAWLHGYKLGVAIMYAKSLWLGIPAFFVCRRLITRIGHLKTILIVMTAGYIYLFIMCIGEYLGLDFVRILGMSTEGTVWEGQGGFYRIYARFWGTPMIAAFILLWYGVIMAAFFQERSAVPRALIIAALAGGALIVFLSGFRGLWAAFALSAGFFFYQKGIRGILILIVIGMIGFQLLPESAHNRLEGLTGEEKDSSVEKRISRAEYALDLIIERPLIGHGWGRSGLVHSDYLQTWADSGFVALLARLAIFIAVLFRLRRNVRRMPPQYRNYAYGFSSCIAAYALMMVGEPLFHHTELHTPTWIITALAYQYPALVANEERRRQHEQDC